MLFKKSMLKKLQGMTHAELDWVEQQCRALKPASDGIRFFSNVGDEQHRREAGRALGSFFEDSFHKHHGEICE